MGDMEDQYKRKTILTTAEPFPGMKKRQPIVSKEEVSNSVLAVDV